VNSAPVVVISGNGGADFS